MDIRAKSSAVYGQVGQSSGEETMPDRTNQDEPKTELAQFCCSRDILDDIKDGLQIYGETLLSVHDDSSQQNHERNFNKRPSKVTFKSDKKVDLLTLLDSTSTSTITTQDGSDCDDTLTVGDLMSLGHMMGRKFSHDDLQHILSQCSDEQDLLDFPDLLNKMQIMTDDLQPCSRSELKQAFKIIDQDEKGYITMRQIKDMAQKIMPNISPEELNSLFDDTLVNCKGGHIDTETFIKFIQNL